MKHEPERLNTGEPDCQDDEPLHIAIVGREARIIRLVAKQMHVLPAHVVAYAIGNAVAALSDPVEQLRVGQLINKAIHGDAELTEKAKEALNETLRTLERRGT